MITIKLEKGLTTAQELWLLKNVGPRLYYLHTGIGGRGWKYNSNINELTLDDDRIATVFILKCV